MSVFQNLPLLLKKKKKKKKTPNCPEILEMVLVWKMCGFQPHSGSEAVLQSFPDQFPLPVSPSSVSSIYHLQASSRPSLVYSGDNSAFCYVKKAHCHVRGWGSSAQRRELATERNVLLVLTLRLPERKFPSPDALHQGYKPL